MNFLNDFDPGKKVDQKPKGSKLKNEIVEKFTFSEIELVDTGKTSLIRMTAKSKADDRTVELTFWMSEKSLTSIYSIFRFVTILAQNTEDYNEEWIRTFATIKANYSNETVVAELKRYLIGRVFYNMLVGQKEFNGNDGIGTVGQVHVNRPFYGGTVEAEKQHVINFYNKEASNNFLGITEKIKPEDIAPPANTGGFAAPTPPPATTGNDDDLPF